MLRKTLVLFIHILFVSNTLKSQICISYKFPDANLLTGDECVVIVWAKNIPANAQVTVLANNEDVAFKRDSVVIYFADDSTISWHEIEIIVSVKLNGRTIYREKKVANYARSISKVAFENKFGDIFYKGIDNIIRISASGVADHDKIIHLGAGLMARKIDNGLYKINVAPSIVPYTQTSIGVSRRLSDESTKSLAGKQFQILDLPVPACKLSINLASLSDSDTSLELNCIVQDHLLGSVNPKVKGYKCSVFTNGNWNVFAYQGEKINGELFVLLKTLRSGDIVNFEKIEIAQTPVLPLCETSLCLLR